MNHRELCEIGAKFLKRSESANGHGCHFAIIEASCYGENPDVFGVRHGTHWYDVGTVLLEAKTSRSDFLADKKKPHRIDPSTGMGKWRYYICPNGLIKPEELPDKWGLLYVSPKGRIKIIKGALAVDKVKNDRYTHRCSTKLKDSFMLHSFDERNIQNEMNLLTMALARMSDAEQILYMQRDYSKIQNKLHECLIKLPYSSKLPEL